MENHTESCSHESVARASSEVPVPGLRAAIENIRSAYPALSVEAIARILGLPCTISQPIQTVLTVIAFSAVHNCQA